MLPIINKYGTLCYYVRGVESTGELPERYNEMKNLLTKLSLVLITGAVLAFPVMSAAECSVSGNIEAAMIDDPDLPMYMYTMTVAWDMDSPHGLSHLDLVVDMQGGTCDCSDFYDAITFGAGSSDGEYDCTVEYMTYLECSGDPSIPGVDGILFKFEPIETEGCEPGPTGTGTFVFYSDMAPVPVNEEVIALVDKASQDSCSGSITGVFPGLACDPVPTFQRSMDSLKSLYR